MLSLLAPARGYAADPLPSPWGEARGLFSGSLKEGARKAANQFGERGCLLIRTQDRWAQVQKDLATLGFVREMLALEASPDFSKSIVLGIFERGDDAHRFDCRQFTNSSAYARMDLVMSYVTPTNQLLRTRPPAWNFMFVVMPKSTTLDVSVFTFDTNSGATGDKALLEWTASFGPLSGDTVNGLQAVITPENVKVKAGEDIRARFELQFKNHRKGNGREFAAEPEYVAVWDGKYSNGYRNHAFEVTTPDGKTTLLRRAEVAEWTKNAPHPVDVKDGTPYALPEWREGEVFKSLKALGLDTSKPGTYTITGIYAEDVNVTVQSRDGKGAPVWGGTIYTAPVTVEVVP